jgi:FixJ family two-component response regulator
MKTITCLLFDDEAESLQILTEIASKNTALSIKSSFADAQTGLDYALKNPVDLIITDLYMPHVSGLDLWMKLHQNAWFIFASGFPELMAQTSGVKVIDSLHKPFSEQRFNEAIDKVKRMIVEDKKMNLIMKQYALLTETEKLVVQNIGTFKETKEIAEEIANSYRTTERHRGNIRKKLDFTHKDDLLIFSMNVVKYLEEN